MPSKFSRVFDCIVPKSVEQIPLTEDHLRRIFMEHDKRGDGHLDKEELRAAFKRLGAMLPGYRANQAIYYADMDGDGVLNEDEIDHLVSYAHHYGYSLGSEDL